MCLDLIPGLATYLVCVIRVLRFPVSSEGPREQLMLQVFEKAASQNQLTDF